MSQVAIPSPLKHDIFMNLWWRNSIAILIGITLTCQVYARPADQVIHGQVVNVTDGDSLTILNESKEQVKIRLAEIDAPEAHQAFGSCSKQSLSDLCFGTQAKIIAQVKDRYKRTMARVKCSGVDVNTEQVYRGMAWVYPQYAKDHNLYIIQRMQS